MIVHGNSPFFQIECERGDDEHHMVNSVLMELEQIMSWSWKRGFDKGYLARMNDSEGGFDPFEEEGD